MPAKNSLPETGLSVNRIHRRDCLEGMRLLPARSINLILSDPPYGITSNRWDTRPDLGQLWTEYKRILAPSGVVALTAQCPFDKQLAMSNRAWLRYEWIWEKSRPTGFLHSRRMPLRAHETVLIFFQHPAKYHPQFLPGSPYRKRRNQSYIRHLGRHVGAAVTDNTGYRYPKSVLHIPSEAGPTHPTQKPVALFEYLIETYTDPGDLVLDTFIGSGTTAIACLNTGRNFLGFERDAEFFTLAEKRINQHRRCLQARSGNNV